MVAELIPVIDLRYLSQSELTTLALSSPNAFDLRRCDDIIVPKIDRSVFNESAGSRKQTYSRLRLAPPKPDSPSLPRRRGRPRSIPLHTAPTTTPSASAPPASDDNSKDPDRRENLLIASFLRQLFSREDPSAQTLTLNKAVSTVCVNENNDGWKNILAAAEEAQKALVLAEDLDREVLNSKGVAVDLVALGQMEDPFGEELRRRSLGLKTEEQLLGFLSGVEGQWASRRKRRRFVDASHFGDVLPKSWKLLLGLKRKEGVAWLDCRRYVSPNGHQFMSCKEVSSYILSLQGAIPPIPERDDNDTPQFDKVTPGSVGQNHQSSISNGNSVFSPTMPASHISGNQEKQPEGTSYYYATPISYIPCDNAKQQLLSSQQRRAKRRKLGKTIVDGVILKDGKFECQFCHKVFNERHRYNGHIGAHVRYQGLTADAVVDEIRAKKITDQSSRAVVPCNSSDKEASTMKIHVSQTINCITQPSSPQAIGGKTEISAAKSADSGHLEGIIEEGVVTEIKVNDCADNTLPSASDLNATPQDCSPMITEEASPSKPVGDEVSDPHIDTFPKHLEDALCSSSNEIDSQSSVSKAKGANSPNMANPDPAVCNTDDVLNSLSIGRTFDGISMAALDADNIVHEAINGSDLPYSPSKAEVFERNDCNSINYTAHKSLCNSDYMDADTNTCYDLSLSLMDMDVKAKDKHNGINPSPGNLSSEFENYNDKLMVEIENHSFSLSGSQLSNECVMYSDRSAHAVGEHVEKPKSKERRDASEYFHQIFDKNVVLDGGMPGTLQNSSTFSSFSSEQMRDLSANADCPFGTDINECVLQDIDKPINELEFFFGGSNSVHEGNAANEMIENDVESETVHISLSNSSWLQSTNVLPVLDMLPDQCGSELGEISRKNENLQTFEELRLGTISPSDFALFTGQDSRTAVEPSISLGYSSELDEQHCPSFQLGWNISLGSMDNTNSFTSVCVWCSTEFRNENSSDEPHSETLGFICPSCKAKLSGP
ncbi:uncharacterized protein LOC110021524 isoform X2 [Phalaenopsis equestris]|uniref:uncharacterized protein LOC110021524 isoform X2 n=1 Tax=Phalaenopsis equestris TaxID=78828 RepID=UPI0009E4B02B|nr:uncharacterized protein LOC110021524 isoform X2 [Phalaenopsis equestris]